MSSRLNMTILLNLCKDLKINAHLATYLYFCYQSDYAKLVEYYHLDNKNSLLKRTVNKKITTKNKELMFSISEDELKELTKLNLIDSYEQDNVIGIDLKCSDKAKQIFKKYFNDLLSIDKDFMFDELFEAYPNQSMSNQGKIFNNLKACLKITDGSFYKVKDYYFNFVDTNEKHLKVLQYLKDNVEIDEYTNNKIGNFRLCINIEQFIINIRDVLN